MFLCSLGTWAKLSGHGRAHRLQLEPSNQSKDQNPPAWILHPSPSSLCCSQVHVTGPDAFVTFPFTASPLQQGCPTATERYFHPGGSISKTSGSYTRAGNRAASSFGGFIWDEGDETRKNRITWDEIKGGERNHPGVRYSVEKRGK